MKLHNERASSSSGGNQKFTENVRYPPIWTNAMFDDMAKIIYWHGSKTFVARQLKNLFTIKSQVSFVPCISRPIRTLASVGFLLEFLVTSNS